MDHGVVVIADCVDQVGADAVNDEHLLGDNGAAQQAAEAGAELGNQGDQGVAQGVSHNNGGALQPLGLGGADVVRLEDIQHGGAAQADEAGDGPGGQGKGRQNGLLKADGGPEVVGHAAHRQQVQLYRENVH